MAREHFICELTIWVFYVFLFYERVLLYGLLSAK